jgi:hypothetical protein
MYDLAEMNGKILSIEIFCCGLESYAMSTDAIAPPSPDGRKRAPNEKKKARTNRE